MIIECFHSGSEGNLYAVSDGKTKLLLECGVQFPKIQKALKFQLSSFAACLVTHGHLDHAQSWEKVSKYMPVYMLGETATSLGASGHKIKAFEPLKTAQIGSFDVLPVPAVHDVPCTAFYLKSTSTGETLLFVTDSAYLKYGIQYAHYAMIECNYQQKIIDESVESGRLDTGARRRVMNTHMEFETCKNLLRNLDSDILREIYIIHASPRHCDTAEVKESLQKEFGKPIYIAAK